MRVGRCVRLGLATRNLGSLLIIPVRSARAGLWIPTNRAFSSAAICSGFKDAKDNGGSAVVSKQSDDLYCGYLLGRLQMAIGNVVERGTYVYVYDEKGRQLSAIASGGGPKDGLVGYTSSTVNIRRGAYIFSYDERGRQISSTPAR